MILFIVGVGGTTRLTQSGLSITEWKPISGTLPPLNEKAWEEAFNLYKQTPEYQLKHFYMNLEQYKGIFFWEYFHRLLARSMGLLFALPLAFFWWRGVLPSWLKKRGLIILGLGGLQGLMGWIMVASGLIRHPFVSHIKLSLHLLLALTVYSFILWTFFELLSLYTKPVSIDPSSNKTEPNTLVPSPPPCKPKQFWVLFTFNALVVLQIAAGGLVAGLRAGKSYNTFPTMNGLWIPENLYTLSPWISNFFDNGTTVQFNHRVLGWILLIASFKLPWLLKNTSKSLYRLSYIIPALTTVQFILGVATLLFKVPVTLGVAHQVTAFILFTCSLFLLYKCKA